MTVDWSTFTRNLCQEANLPSTVPENGREQRENFFKKYASMQPPIAYEKKIITSSHVRELEGLQDNERIKILQCLSVFEKPKMTSKSQETLIYWCKVLKEVTSGFTLHLILEANSLCTEDSPQRFARVMQKLVEMAEDIQSLIPLLVDYNRQKMSLRRLSHTLDSKKVEIEQKKYPEKPIKEVYADFESQPFPLKKEQLDHCFTQYEELLDIERKIKKLDLKEWVRMVQEIRLSPISPENLLTLLAIGRQALCYKYKILPYNTQIITVLALLNYGANLKGRIAQVKTGDGKSTIIALMAFVQLCQGKTVDIVSSSRYLAERDADKYSPFFRDFGIEVSHICTDSPSAENFKGQVIFGTNYDFEFALMRDNLSANPGRLITEDGKTTARPFHVVIVDEADNMFIDSALNSARISTKSLATRSWIYPLILKFINEREDQIFWSMEKIVSELRNELLKTEKGKEVKDIPDDQFILWISATLQALRYEEGKQYVIKNQEYETPFGTQTRKGVVIVDWKNTGRLNEKSRWQHGLHEFIEAKHNLPINEETYSSSALCHPVYFSNYKEIYGLTGTLGLKIEREELEKTYGIDSFDVPPHRKNLRKMLDPIIVDSEEEYQKELLKEINSICEAGRPSLLLFETINESQAFAEFLQKNNIDYQILNEMQPEDEDFVIARAGKPATVTIATNTAGRGTDIILHPESSAKGGLHVVFTFFPQNDRVELQGFGRAARQGLPGSCRMILKNKMTLPELYKEREWMVRSLSEARIKQIENEKRQHRYLLTFWQQMHQFNSLPVKRFTFRKVESWLAAAKRDLAESDHIGFDILESVVKVAKEPGSVLVDEEMFGQKVKEIFGELANQQWARLFYHQLSLKGEEKEIEQLFQASKKVWETYFNF